MIRFPITHYEWIKRNVTGVSQIEEFLKPMRGLNFSFSAFSRAFEISDIIRDVFKFESMFRNPDLNNINLFARQVYHCYQMQEHGEKVYFFSKEVCDILTSTRLTIDAEFIEAPFEQIYISTESNLMLRDATSTGAMRGAYVQLVREEDGIRRMRFIANSDVKQIKSHNDVNYYSTFKIPDHGSVEEYLDRQIADFQEGKELKIMNSSFDMGVAKKVFSFLVNALLYIGCKNVDLVRFKPDNLEAMLKNRKSGSKRAKLERMATSSAQLPFIIVSPNKKYSYHEDPSACGRKLDHQVLVSGHWRGQWKGSEESRKKEVIRIQPYIKGAALDKPAFNKPYLVK